jgi:hypothetical protein
LLRWTQSCPFTPQELASALVISYLRCMDSISCQSIKAYGMANRCFTIAISNPFRGNIRRSAETEEKKTYVRTSTYVERPGSGVAIISWPSSKFSSSISSSSSSLSSHYRIIKMIRKSMNDAGEMVSELQVRNKIRGLKQTGRLISISDYDDDGCPIYKWVIQKREKKK